MPAPTPPEDSGAPSAWQFFRTSTDGCCVFGEELNMLPRYTRAAIIVLMAEYVSGDVPVGAIKYLRDNIFELQWSQGDNRFRVLFFRWGPLPVALTAFHSHRRKTPKVIFGRALDRQRAWRNTFGERPPRQ